MTHRERMFLNAGRELGIRMIYMLRAHGSPMPLRRVLVAGARKAHWEYLAYLRAAKGLS